MRINRLLMAEKLLNNDSKEYSLTGIETGPGAASPGFVDDGESRLRQVTHELRERVKELNCLYGISQLIEQESTSLEEVLQRVVELIPASWQYPEDTCARIRLREREYKTHNFLETAWKQREPISVNGDQAGTLEVYYLREKPHSYEGPFLKEERSLIHAVAERVGHMIEHKFAEEKLRALYSEEKSLREKLQTEMRVRVDFTRSLIHELKTPLTALVATSQLLLNEAEGTRLGELARYVWEGASNLDNRINELHDTVKGEIGKLKLEPKPLDLKLLLTSIAKETQALCIQYGVRLELKLVEPLPRVNADPTRVRQIILNLLNNAFKHAGNCQRVVIAVSKRPRFALIEVRDYGKGISAEDLLNLFKPGYQLAYGGAKTGGLGIGLALCKILVELHGGEIWVESRPGKGSSFFFTLPLLRAKRSSPSNTP